MDDPYSILGVSKDATQKEIKRQFQEFARKCHPDKLHTQATPTERSLATEEFQKLSSAYQLLVDEKSRHDYDISYKTKQLTEDYIINETLHLSDMTCNEEEGEYMYDCRCGGVYSVSVTLVREEVNHKGASQLIVTCSNCSLHVKIVNVNDNIIFNND